MADCFPAAFSEFARLFLAGEYRAANEVLERHWQGDRNGFDKAFIQIAVAFHQEGRGRHEGARKLLAKARGLLEGYRPRYRGVDVERVVRAVEAWHAADRLAAAEALEEIRAALRPAAEAAGQGCTPHEIDPTTRPRG